MSRERHVLFQPSRSAYIRVRLQLIKMLYFLLPNVVRTGAENSI